MRPSALRDILLLCCSVTFAFGQDLPDLEGTCENRHSGANDNNNKLDTRHDSCSIPAAATQTKPNPKQSCMRAAVVEHARIDRDDCKTQFEANLRVYHDLAKIARENGAKMIVFPEDGILMSTARNVFPCLEEIPEPAALANPCSDATNLYERFPILTTLSCLAKNNNLYVIANYGTKERRNSSDIAERDSIDSKQTSVSADYMMLNTDVIFDPSGNYIGRYRKWNPFTETEFFEKAPKLEHVYFDTDYGRFGVFTCFDMMFKRPAIELVEEYQIDTAIFPTWWFDELPLLTAVQYQDGWSETNRVNLLASNILKPSRGSLGSSIFSGSQSVYVAPDDYEAESQRRSSKVLLGTIQTSGSGEVCRENFAAKIVELDHPSTDQNYRHKNYKLHTNDVVQVLNNSFEGSQDVCSGEFCCRVHYKLTSKSIADITSGQVDAQRLIVVARDGPRPGIYRWYEQVCAVATLKRPCGSCDDEALLSGLEYNEDALVEFERLSIEASFDTKYVYPTCGHNLSKLVDRNERKFECQRESPNSENRFRCRLNFEAKSTNELYSFGLYGRVYERDLRH